MKKVLIITVLLAPLFSLFAQSDEDLKKHGVSHYVERQVEYEDGNATPRILKEWYYNTNGDVVEYKDWTKDGEVKDWEKYIYNAAGLLQEKQELNKKGEVKGKVIYEYKDSLIVKKSYYDKKGRLEKEKLYEYDFHN